MAYWGGNPFTNYSTQPQQWGSSSGSSSPAGQFNPNAMNFGSGFNAGGGTQGFQPGSGFGQFNGGMMPPWMNSAQAPQQQSPGFGMPPWMSGAQGGMSYGNAMQNPGGFAPGSGFGQFNGTARPNTSGFSQDFGSNNGGWSGGGMGSGGGGAGNPNANLQQANWQTPWSGNNVASNSPSSGPAYGQMNNLFNGMNRPRVDMFGQPPQQPWNTTPQVDPNTNLAQQGGNLGLPQQAPVGNPMSGPYGIWGSPQNMTNTGGGIFGPATRSLLGI